MEWPGDSMQGRGREWTGDSMQGEWPGDSMQGRGREWPGDSMQGRGREWPGDSMQGGGGGGGGKEWPGVTAQYHHVSRLSFLIKWHQRLRNTRTSHYTHIFANHCTKPCPLVPHEARETA